MSFFSRAWDAAGSEYGRQNAQRYARVARGWMYVKIIAIFLFACWMYYLSAK